MWLITSNAWGNNTINQGQALAAVIVAILFGVFVYALIYYTSLTSQRIAKDSPHSTIFPLWIFWGLGLLNTGVVVNVIWTLVVIVQNH